MKITSFPIKTSLEVNDTDILVIEDAEDTKQISVAEFKEYLKSTSGIGVDREIKKTINETLDNVAASLIAAKYIITELKTYRQIVWIDTDDGNIQYALQDVDTEKYLTADEIVALTDQNEEGNATNDFITMLQIQSLMYEADSYAIFDFNTAYETASELNPVLYEAGAGFVRATFNDLEHNQIAQILYDNVFVALNETELYRYVFTTDESTFSNSVSYIE